MVALRRLYDYLPPLFAGALVGFNNLARLLAMVTLIFAGSLAAGAPFALQIFLFSSILATIVLNFGKNWAGPVFASVQNAPIAALFPAIVIIGDQAGVPGIFILLGVTTLLGGVILTLLGHFGLGGLVRSIPYAVTTGFLAASGALLLTSALEMVVVGSFWDLRHQIAIMSSEAVLPLLAIGFAVLLFLCARLFPVLGLILGFITGVIITYLIIDYFNIDSEEAIDLGLLPKSRTALSAEDITGALDVSILKNIVLWKSIYPYIIASVMIGIFGTLLNGNGVEVIIERNIDLRGSMIKTGIANILSSLFGSSISYISASNTSELKSISPNYNRHRQLAVLAMCLSLLCVIPFSQTIYLNIPPYISSGILLFIGFLIVHQWLFLQYKKMSLSDWCLSVAIVIVSLSLGIVAAIGMGIVAALVIFAIHYARLSVIRGVTDLSRRHSNVDRGPVETSFLDEVGHEVCLITLQGFLFFGTSVQIVNYIDRLMAGRNPPKGIILDFKHVIRIDASAIVAIQRLVYADSHKRCKLMLCEMNQKVLYEIEKSDFWEYQGLSFEVIPTTDRAVEAMEEYLLLELTFQEIEESALSAIIALCGDEGIGHDILNAMEFLERPAGSKIISQGEVSTDIFILDRGSLSVVLNDSAGSAFRLRLLKSGALFGEIASYAGLPRTADVVAETDVAVYRTSHELLMKLQDTNPKLAAAIHRLVASSLAEKLNRTNKLLREYI